MKTFKSVKRLKEASLEDITDAVGKAKGAVVYNHFHPDEAEGVSEK